MERRSPLISDVLRERPGVYDIGNGALETIEANPGFPGILRVTVRSYCGRHEDDCRYYRLTAEPTRRFATLEEALAARPKVVAIGEIGLDLHYDFATFAEQETALRAQLALARETELPIIVHCREAYPQALGILREEAAAVGSQPWGVMHCYFGTLEQARAFYDMGLLLGIGGSVTFRNAEQVREVVKAMPLESLVLETDAPYMAPVPYRGKRNEPAWLTLVVEKIAEVKGLAPEIVAHATTENAWRLFRWPLPAQGNRAATEPA